MKFGLDEEKTWEDEGMRKLLESRDFINCPTVYTKAEVWPLHNVIRTLSSIRYSLLVEILVWRNFWIVFSPRKSVGEKKKGSFQKTNSACIL